MSKPKDGGPAFPIPGHKGMSIRDYFAAKAMQSIAAKIFEDLNKGDDSPEQALEIVASVAYNMADAMIEVRER